MSVSVMVSAAAVLLPPEGPGGQGGDGGQRGAVAAPPLRARARAGAAEKSHSVTLHHGNCLQPQYNPSVVYIFSKFTAVCGH